MEDREDLVYYKKQLKESSIIGSIFAWLFLIGTSMIIASILFDIWVDWEWLGKVRLTGFVITVVGLFFGKFAIDTENEMKGKIKEIEQYENK